MSSPISTRSWPTMPIPFPSVHRSPIVMMGSPRISACDGIPAEILASGPTVVPRPSAIRPSPNNTDCGNAIMLPSPKLWNDRARRCLGPIAPRRVIPVHVAWITSPAMRSTFSRSIVEGYGDGHFHGASTAYRVAVRLPADGRSLSEIVATRHRRSRRNGATRPRGGARRAAIARPPGRKRSGGRACLRRTRRRGRRRHRRSLDLRQRADRRAVVRRGPHTGHQLLGGRTHTFGVDVPLSDRLARGGAARARSPDGDAGPATGGDRL